jgi:hypothetical protein
MFVPINSYINLGSEMLYTSTIKGLSLMPSLATH